MQSAVQPATQDLHLELGVEDVERARNRRCRERLHAAGAALNCGLMSTRRHVSTRVEDRDLRATKFVLEV